MPRKKVEEPLDPRERFSLYRLCECPECGGEGKRTLPYHGSPRLAPVEKCPECRGEGRVREEVASRESPEAVGVALVTLAREGEWQDADGKPCAFGLLDRMGEKNEKWLILPWPQTARTLSAAGRLLRSAQD